MNSQKIHNSEKLSINGPQRIRDYGGRKKILLNSFFSSDGDVKAKSENSDNNKSGVKNYCCCCRQRDNLHSMLEPYLFQDKIETCANIIMECFHIKFKNKIDDMTTKMCELCENCILHLQDAVQLQHQINAAYLRIEGEKKNGILIGGFCDIKPFIKEETDASCFCCFSDTNLFSVCEPRENDETHISLIAECFQIELNTVSDKYMCGKCVKRLNEAVHFRFQLQIAYTRIAGMFEEHAPKYEDDFKIEDATMVFKDEPDANCERDIEVDLFDVNDGFQIDVEGDASEIFGQLEGLYVCKDCEVSFGTLAELRLHSKMHHTFKCNKCDKVFKWKSALTDHLMGHMRIKRFKCDICNKRFQWRSNLCIHKQKVHLKADAPTCPVCNKKFIRKSSFLFHLHGHLGLKDLECSVCYRVFERKVHLVEHILAHDKNLLNDSVPLFDSWGERRGKLLNEPKSGAQRMQIYRERQKSMNDYIFSLLDKVCEKMSIVPAILNTRDSFSEPGPSTRNIQKREYSQCCRCSNDKNLFSILKPYPFRGRMELYSNVISECFQIKINVTGDRRKYMLCENCTLWIKDITIFRCQLKTAYERIEKEATRKKIIDESKIKEDPVSVCMCCKSDMKLFGVFESQNNSESYATSISQCFQLKLNVSTESITKSKYSICSKCLACLHSAIRFKMLLRVM